MDDAYRYVHGDLDLSNLSVTKVHRILSDAAAEIANQDPRRDQRFLFKGASRQSVRAGVEGLSLEWDPEKAHLRYEPEERERVATLMEQIGIEAIQTAIRVNPNLFVGVILGEARAGRDYFDTFND